LNLEVKQLIEAIAMDNNMAKDALDQKNIHALGAIIERQRNELESLIKITHNDQPRRPG